MRRLLLLLAGLALGVPAAAIAAPDGKVSVVHDGELDGFSRDGAVHRFGSVRAFTEFTGRPQDKATLKGCGYQRSIVEDLKGPPGTDGLSGSARFKTDRGARRCARKASLPKGRKVHGLPHSKLFLLGEGDHPGRNLRFVVGATYYSIAFTPTSAFDPGNSGLIAAARLLYARVR